MAEKAKYGFAVASGKRTSTRAFLDLPHAGYGMMQSGYELSKPKEQLLHSLGIKRL